MLKTIFKPIAKMVKGKLNESGLEEELAKHPNYLAKAKELWEMINEELGISDTVENKLISKVDEFEKALFAKFPELTKEDITEIKQSIIGEFNSGKENVLSQVDALKQLQDSNTKLQEENIKLKNELNKFKSADTPNTVTASTETSATTTIDVK